MSRWFWMLAILVVGGVATAIAQPPDDREPAAGPPAGPPDGPRGQRRANDADRGRPVEKIAQELGVSPEKFREVFRRVKPAPRGERPTREQREANRQILAEGLGVSPERLDEVMDKYRPEGPDGGPEHRGPGGRGAASDDRASGRRGPIGPGSAEDRGRPAGPPPHNPERFVAHALEFDADADGKLDRDELMAFAHDMGRRRHEQEAPGPPRRGPAGPDGYPEDPGPPERGR